MSEIAVIGSQRFTLGFRLAGIKKIHEAETEIELEKAILSVKRDPEASILVMETSDVGRLETRLREELEASVTPTLVAVGTEDDNSLRRKIKQAVGVDLW